MKKYNFTESNMKIILLRTLVVKTKHFKSKKIDNLSTQLLFKSHLFVIF